MRFNAPPPRRTVEPVLPMINVVFLLLIFFLMTARIAPAPPFDVSPPAASDVAATDADQVLYLSAGGEMALNGTPNAAVWEKLAALPEGAAVVIHADAQMPAADLARVVSRLSGLGITRIDLAAVAK